MINNGFYASPIGNILLTADHEALISLKFSKEIPDNCKNQSSPIIEESIIQLRMYFSRQLQKFELPLKFKATDFQKHVFEEVQKIPFGETVTYLQLARLMGSTRLTRAVAGANAANALLILIPCHRVVGKNGTLTGYSGELWRKEWLLNHENGLHSLLLS